MWISKKKYQELEKRIADLEVQVQSQQIIYKNHIESEYEFNNEIIRLSNIVLNAQTNFRKS
jgi:uncharacterized coiled-coil protein SlyX